MRPHKKILFTAACCAVLTGPLVLQAQTSQPKRPAKAAASVPLTKPLVADTVIRMPGVAALPKKPPTASAVNTPHPGAPVDRSIIFVGGKPRAGSHAQLNPQPIPPGVGGPVNPPH